MMKRILLVIAGAFFFALGFGPALIGAAIGMIALGWVAGILHLVLILLGGALPFTPGMEQTHGWPSRPFPWWGPSQRPEPSSASCTW